MIESLEVDPSAAATLFGSENIVVPEGPRYHAPELKEWNYQDENYRNGVIAFMQGHLVRHSGLGEYQLHRQVSSLKVNRRH